MATFTGADKAIGFLFDMVANIANDYDATATYAVNDYVIHGGILYKCTSNIIIAETFTPAHWTAVLIMDEISAGGGGGGSTTLAGLSDVALASVANGDVLTYDSALSKWKNAAGGGGGGGSTHTYSTTEQIVGTWIYGEPIYETTFDLGANTTISYTGWTTTSIHMPNLGGIISGMILTETLGTSTPVMATYNANKYIQLQSLRNNYASTARYVVLQYTKAA